MSPFFRNTLWLTLPVLRPTSVRNCTSEMCNVHWRVSPWRMCTATCGSGFQSRRVECVHLHNNKTLPDLHCAWQRRPVTWQHCNITSCGSMYLSHTELLFFKCFAVLDLLLQCTHSNSIVYSCTYTISQVVSGATVGKGSHKSGSWRLGTVPTVASHSCLTGGKAELLLWSFVIVTHFLKVQHIVHSEMPFCLMF